MFRRKYIYITLLFFLVSLLVFKNGIAVSQGILPPVETAGEVTSTTDTPQEEQLIIILESPSLQERIQEVEQQRPLTGAEKESLQTAMLADITAEQQALLAELSAEQLINDSGPYFTTLLNGLAVTAPVGSRAAITAYPQVEAIYDDMTAEIQLAQSVPQIGAPAVWAMEDGNGNSVRGYGIQVGILDTGIDYTHPDLGGCFGSGCKVAMGYDFVNGDNDPMDDHGHGTHVAGIVAADGGVTGVAPDATLAAYKVCSAGGICYHSDIIAALERALTDGMDIVNISIGGPPGPPNSPLEAATNNAVDAGLFVAAAAGDEGERGYRTITTPGVAEKALTVGNAARTSQPYFSTSKGPVEGYRIKPDLTAPGESIVSTYLGHGYQALTGTSMATPHAAGAAALLLQLHPDWTPPAIKGNLKAKANLWADPFVAGNGFLHVDQAANTPLLIQPASLNMGRVESDKPIWVTTGSLTLTNLTTSRKSVRLHVNPYTLPIDAVQFAFSNPNPKLLPGQSVTVFFTVTVKVPILPYPPAPQYMHYAELHAFAGTAYGGRIPFTFAPIARDCETQTDIPLMECQALVTFYEETAGQNWWWQSGWIDTPPCSWQGITCSGGHVTSLDFVDNNLIGSIPASLSSLTELNVLQLNLNNLFGEIPSEIGLLSKLRLFSAADNYLDGEIPAELGNLAQLEELRLWQNQLSGALPATLGNLTNLRILELNQNYFDGGIPTELGNLSNLIFLNLGKAGLYGPIPPELGNLDNLQALYLYENYLYGTIPAALGNLSQLVQLDLNNNNLTGPIPAVLGNLHQLQWLRLRYNDLEGPIPPELGNLTAMYYLELNGNNLSGSIPPELGQLTNLHVLFLQENLLCGSIPAELGNLTSLEQFALHYNALTGEIPASLANLTTMYITDLGYNSLTATDPALLAFLSQKDPDWYMTQTVTPEDVAVRIVWHTAVGLSWTPIPYTGNGGYYEIGVATTPGGPYDFSRITPTKKTHRFAVTGLEPATTYYFVIRTFTPIHPPQKSALTSGPSIEVTATTLPAE